MSSQTGRPDPESNNLDREKRNDKEDYPPVPLGKLYTTWCLFIVIPVHKFSSRRASMIERHLKKFTAAVFILTLILLKLIIGPVTCNSGWKSPSIGRSGACSHHGGVAGWKGSLPILLSGGVAFWFFISFSPKSTPLRVTITPSELPSGTNSTQPATLLTPNSERKSQNIVTCPRCSSLMSLRTAKKGRNSGSKFWGCSKYPRCKGTRPYTPEQGV